MRYYSLLACALLIKTCLAIRLVEFSPVSVKLNELTDYVVKIDINKEELKRFLNSVVVIDFPEHYEIDRGKQDKLDYMQASIKMGDKMLPKHFKIKKMHNRIWFRVASIFQYKYFTKFKAKIEHFDEETKTIRMIFKNLRNPKANSPKPIALKLVDKCRNSVFFEVNDIRIKYMDHEYVITTNMDCKYLYLGYVSKAFFVYPKQPIPKDTLVKIHTDYDNYVRIKPNVLLFRSGVVFPKKLQISISNSYPLKEVTFKFTLLKGNPKEYHFEKSVYKVVDISKDFELSEADTTFCVPDLIIFPPTTKLYLNSPNTPFVFKLSHAFANKRRIKNPFYDFANNQLISTEPESFDFEPHQNTVFILMTVKRKFQFLEIKVDRFLTFQFINYSSNLSHAVELIELRESLEDKVLSHPDINSFYLQTDRYASYQIQSLEDLVSNHFNDMETNLRNSMGKKRISHYSMIHIANTDRRRFDLISMKLDGKEHLNRKGKDHNYDFLDNIKKFRKISDKLWLTDYILHPTSHMLQFTANKSFEACVFISEKLLFQLLYIKVDNIESIARRYCFKKKSKIVNYSYKLHKYYKRQRVHISRSVSFYDNDSNTHRISMSIPDFQERSDFYGVVFLKSSSGEIYLTRFVIDINNKQNLNLNRQMFFIQSCMSKTQLRFAIYTKHWSYDQEFFILPSPPLLSKNYAVFKLKTENCTTNPKTYLFYSVNLSNIEEFKNNYYDEIVDSENKAVFKRFSPFPRFVRFEKYREYEHGIELGAKLMPIRTLNTIGFVFITRLYIANSDKQLVQIIELKLNQNADYIEATHLKPLSPHYSSPFLPFYKEKLPNLTHRPSNSQYDFYFTIRNLPIHDIYYLHMQSCFTDRYFKKRECLIDSTDGYLEFMTHYEVILELIAWSSLLNIAVVLMIAIII